MTDAEMQMYNALNRVVKLFEAWRDGIFSTMGIKWTVGPDEPPAIIAARQAIENFDAQRCTGDTFTCPVGHDHP